MKFKVLSWTKKEKWYIAFLENGMKDYIVELHLQQNVYGGLVIHGIYIILNITKKVINKGVEFVLWTQGFHLSIPDMIAWNINCSLKTVSNCYPFHDEIWIKLGLFRKLCVPYYVLRSSRNNAKCYKLLNSICWMKRDIIFWAWR